MSTDRRLQSYWTHVSLWHKTGDAVWVSLLDVMSMTQEGPAGRAAIRFVANHNLKVARDSG